MINIAVLLFLGMTNVQMAFPLPAEVLIIRHGEKPPVGDDLNASGVARAAALPNLFINDSRFLDFGTPAAIYAMRPSHGDPSNRPIETITPLAKALQLSPIVDFKKKETSEVAEDILNNHSYDNKTVLICWEHKVIPDIVTALGATPVAGGWPDDVFDRVWKITFKANGTAKLEDLPQRLMPGDETN